MNGRLRAWGYCVARKIDKRSTATGDWPATICAVRPCPPRVAHQAASWTWEPLGLPIEVGASASSGRRPRGHGSVLRLMSGKGTSTRAGRRQPSEHDLQPIRIGTDGPRSHRSTRRRPRPQPSDQRRVECLARTRLAHPARVRPSCTRGQRFNGTVRCGGPGGYLPMPIWRRVIWAKTFPCSAALRNHFTASSSFLGTPSPSR